MGTGRESYEGEASASQTPNKGNIYPSTPSGKALFLAWDFADQYKILVSIDGNKAWEGVRAPSPNDIATRGRADQATAS